MSIEFEKQLMALDRDKLRLFLLATISMYNEYVTIHGYDEDIADHAAISEMLDGTEAMIELDSQGEL